MSVILPRFSKLLATVWLILGFCGPVACADDIVAARAEEIMRLLGEGKFTEASTAFHYPPSYSAEELEPVINFETAAHFEGLMTLDRRGK